MEFAAKPASKSVKASPLKVAKDAVWSGGPVAYRWVHPLRPCGLAAPRKGPACLQAQLVKGFRLHRARIAGATDAGFDPRREDGNGACKTPQMDRRGDQAAGRTRAAEGKSAGDGARAWASHRVR